MVRRDTKYRPWLESLDLRVTPTLALNLSSLPAGVVGDAYSNAMGQPVQFSVTGGTEDTYKYSLGDTVSDTSDADALIDATLPAGMTFTEDGLLGGTPQQAGVFTVVVQANDKSGDVVASEMYSLAVTAVPGNPDTITLATSNTDTSTFAGGTWGRPTRRERSPAPGGRGATVSR